MMNIKKNQEMRQEKVWNLIYNYLIQLLLFNKTTYLSPAPPPKLNPLKLIKTLVNVIV